MVHQGHWHGLPCLDPQVDTPAIWAVEPWTTREEIGNLYYELYKLKRLPGSTPCGLRQMEEELTTDMVSSLEDCLRWREVQPPGDLEEPGLADAQPSRSNTPRGGVPPLRETSLR